MAFALAAVEGSAIQEAFEVDVGGVAQLGSTLHSLSGSHILSHTIQLSGNLLIGDDSFCLLDLQALVVAQSDLGVNLGGQSQGDDVILADVHIGQVGTADGLHILVDDSKLVDLGEDLFQAVFIENMSAVHALDHLPGSLALTEAREHNVLALLQVSGVNALFHQFLVNFNHDGGLVALFFNALYVHNYCSSQTGA